MPRATGRRAVPPSSIRPLPTRPIGAIRGFGILSIRAVKLSFFVDRIYSTAAYAPEFLELRRHSIAWNHLAGAQRTLLCSYGSAAPVDVNTESLRGMIDSG